MLLTRGRYHSVAELLQAPTVEGLPRVDSSLRWVQGEDLFVLGDSLEAQTQARGRRARRSSSAALGGDALAAGGSDEGRQGSCPGADPIWWTPAAECRQRSTERADPCAGGDVGLALQGTAIARCGPDGGSFRYFNRSMTMACLARAARTRREGAYEGASPDSFRLLFVGVSNMRHIWHAFGADDVFSDADRGSKNCYAFRGASQTLRSFAPHAVDYQPWQVVVNTTRIFHRTSPSCWATHSLGGAHCGHHAPCPAGSRRG